MHNRLTNITIRVSVVSGGAQAVGGGSIHAVMTPDARYLAFSSDATNLVTGDTNANTDVFLHDRVAVTTQRVSVTNGGSQSLGTSLVPSLSANGQVVAFTSFAADLVAGDTNGKFDVFVRNVAAGTTTRVSVGTSSAQGNETVRIRRSAATGASSPSGQGLPPSCQMEAEASMSTIAQLV